jgi:hypothetical protein
MKNINKTTLVLLTGLLIFLTSVTVAFIPANASIISNNDSGYHHISETEINALLSLYSIDEEIPINNIIVKIFDKNDNLIFSDKVCQNLSECDERLNHLINQSDFLTEVDNTKIYILNQ